MEKKYWVHVKVIGN